jgi:hypothetical protein
MKKVFFKGKQREEDNIAKKCLPLRRYFGYQWRRRFAACYARQIAK